MQALQKGYAVAGTDTGHVGPGGATDGAWALNNLERIVNYAHAAIHRVTETSKAAVARPLRPRAGEILLRRLLERRPRGADRRPSAIRDDFNAIIAGAPAQDIRGIIATFMNITQA